MPTSYNVKSVYWESEKVKMRRKKTCSWIPFIHSSSVIAFLLITAKSPKNEKFKKENVQMEQWSA